MKLPSHKHLLVVAAFGTVLVTAGGVLGWREWRAAQAAGEAARIAPVVAPVAEVAASGTPATTAGDDAAWQAFKAERQGCPVEEPTVAVAFVGDVMLSRSVGAIMKASGNYDAPFAGFKTWLRSADIAVGNLETAITPGREVKAGEMSFRADEAAAGALAKAGFDVLSLANNHTPNFGERGLTDTFKNLKDAGVQYVGAGRDEAEAYRAAYVKANGLTFAFVAQNDSDVVPRSYGAGPKRAGTALLDVPRIKQAVTAARSQADVVIFLMHSGNEYKQEANARQKTYAHAAVDAGADLVVGHHAHVVQEMETYAGKPILYGLGNFVFDQTWSRDTQEGLAVRAVWRGRTLVRLEMEPVSIGAKYRPDFAGTAAARRINARLNAKATAETAWRWDDLERRLKPEEHAVITMGKASSSGCARLDVAQPMGTARLSLIDGTATLASGGAVVWTSPDDIWVDYVVVGSTAGADVATLAYWQQDADGPRMRLGALTWRGGQAAWQPDARVLRAPVCALAAIDLDGGSSSEIITVLGDYADGLSCAGKEVIVLRGHDGAFNEIASSAPGRYSGLTVGQRQGHAFFQPHVTH